MSTRSIIARPDDLGATGRYHHFDGYPTGLGQALWALYHGPFGGDVAAMTTTLIDDHPGGWSNIIGADFTKAPGYREYGASTVAEDAPHCYCHGDRHEPEMGPHVCRCGLGDPSGCDPLFTEYLYVLTPVGLECWFSAGGDDGQYRHRRFGLLPWDGPEPSWAAVEGVMGEAATLVYEGEATGMSDEALIAAAIERYLDDPERTEPSAGRITETQMVGQVLRALGGTDGIGEVEVIG